MSFCPHCGQPILVRYGVKLTPKKAALLDLIERRRAGLALANLAAVLYPGVAINRACERIKTQVCQINDLMAGTDYRIVRQAGRYHLRGHEVKKFNGTQRPARPALDQVSDPKGR